MGERTTTMVAHGERQRLQADHAAHLVGRVARLRAAVHRSAEPSRSRKNPGPLINALHAWLTDGPPAPPVTESWLLGVPDSW